jgi:S-adenosylmethionine:tRNA ribosyltransferase-isomerase
MTPATHPPHMRDAVRLLSLDSGGLLGHHSVTELPDLLSPGDVVVVNDAATIPASIQGRLGDQPVEIRLAQHLEDNRWQAIALGAGDWRSDTNYRQKPQLRIGDRVDFDCGVVEIIDIAGSLLTVAVHGEQWRAVYGCGRPVQYSHLAEDLELWSVQTVYGSRPWSVEMPSAGRPLSWRVLLELRRRAIEIVSVTHAAGLSATGDAELDAKLPLPEHYEVPQRTVDVLHRAQEEGNRIIAVGTSVVRAIEGATINGGGVLKSGPGVTDLRIEPSFVPRYVDTIISGLHEPSESHFQLLAAFTSVTNLEELGREAKMRGYRSHEFGDLCMVARR